ncbi:poly(rC)-binding protein 3 isoform X3 [Octopus bimaculoides]|uniref:Poly(RC)-binding protein 3 isoform X3 n=1 Tax=Octopus sinensis TaxID=2607531 RepID=A0A7E6FHV9_9MOLL|nr:poly(rC)-binding protein 3 isoform X3 [Octopus sinensis]XP_052829778.1 poly(rC)-binding protein 3 isoform X3 [Octopus bimaculoides]|eukprot:XP_014773350.1 PREDICTED: poly(rC)-binding protein 3-like isoform X1 [Octopus bimaculoides]
MATERKMVQQNDNSPCPIQTAAILTVRMVMQGKEVGSIIGKKGDNIKKFREESGAKINISDGSCPERIVTITGSLESINRAFTMICKKFEEDLQNTPTVPKPPVTLRLVVPASQCGSLIGKGGSKIKEIRESTGASIQVASEMLPNSTERAVTISGTADAIIQCIQSICSIMLESPPKGATIPYRPKPVMPPVIFAGGQAYTIQGQVPVPSPEVNKLHHQFSLGQTVPIIPAASQTLLPGHLSLPGVSPVSFSRPNNAAATVQNSQQTTEMSIPNDLIGCIIGRAGQKINEIRQISGATIKISNAEEGSSDRKVTITGTPDTIGLAQYLINTSMEMHKNLTLDPASTPTTTSLTSVQSHHPLAIPLNQLVKPMPYLNVPGVFDLNNDRKHFTAKMRVGVTANSALKKVERAKFAPY